MYVYNVCFSLILFVKCQLGLYVWDSQTREYSNLYGEFLTMKIWTI